MHNQIRNDRAFTNQFIFGQAAPQSLDDVFAPIPLQIQRPAFIFTAQEIGQTSYDGPLGGICIGKLVVP